MKRTSRAFFSNLGLLFLGVVMALGVAEAISRIAIPVFPGTQKVGAQGEHLTIDAVQPGAVYRQLAAEYDVSTTITLRGFRVPDVQENPAVIFIGDSFTFGQGLSDEETFVYHYAESLDIPCVNLGEPGIGTITALDRLERYLEEEEWQPQRVFLFMMAMTRFMGAGNDLYDNWEEARMRARRSVANATELVEDKREVKGPFLSNLQRKVLRCSNLARVVKFYFGPVLKQYLSPSPRAGMLREALAVTQKQLARFSALAREHQFEGQVFLLHPIQDILKGTHVETLRKVQEISPILIQPTAQLFEHEPQQYYFSLDGHLNAKGSRKLAEFLVLTFP